MDQYYGNNTFQSEERSMNFFNNENPSFCLEDEDFHNQHPNRIPLDFQKEPEHISLEEIFSDNFPPKFTTISISTRSNRSYDINDMSEEFFSSDFGMNHLSGEPLDYDPYQESEQRIVPPEVEVKEEKKSILENSDEKTEEQKKVDDSEGRHDETKNIPKNYIKAIFTFILENTEYIQRLFEKVNLNEENSSVARFLDYIKLQKKTKRYTIQRLKSLWLDRENGKAMRIISSEFLRKRSLSYIFGSKIEKKMHHIKHRSKFLKAIENPSEFTNIK